MNKTIKFTAFFASIVTVIAFVMSLNTQANSNNNFTNNGNVNTVNQADTININQGTTNKIYQAQKQGHYVVKYVTLNQTSDITNIQSICDVYAGTSIQLLEDESLYLKKVKVLDGACSGSIGWVSKSSIGSR